MTIERMNFPEPTPGAELPQVEAWKKANIDSQNKHRESIKNTEGLTGADFVSAVNELNVDVIGEILLFNLSEEGETTLSHHDLKHLESTILGRVDNNDKTDILLLAERVKIKWQ